MKKFLIFLISTLILLVGCQSNKVIMMYILIKLQVFLG